MRGFAQEVGQEHLTLVIDVCRLSFTKFLPGIHFRVISFLSSCEFVDPAFPDELTKPRNNTESIHEITLTEDVLKQLE